MVASRLCFLKENTNSISFRLFVCFVTTYFETLHHYLVTTYFEVPMSEVPQSVSAFCYQPVFQDMRNAFFGSVIDEDEQRNELQVYLLAHITDRFIGIMYSFIGKFSMYL